MLLLLILAFNCFVMFLALYIMVMIFHPITTYQVFLLSVVSFVVVCSLAFLFNSFAGQWFFRLLSGARKTISREDVKLNPVIKQVQHAIKITFGLENRPVHIMVADSPIPNAFAIGKNTLVVSRALYETATEEELSGVIAHEFGHLHYGDSQKLGIALGVSVVSIVVAAGASIFATFIQTIGKLFSGNKGGIISIFGLVFSLFAVFFLIFVRLGNWTLTLAMLFVGRKQEYKADKFAVKAGFGEGLLSFLEKLKNMEFEQPTGLFDKLSSTHPPTMLRIGEVEKLCIK